MKEIDDTPLPKTESEMPVGELVARLNKVSDHIGLALDVLRKQEQLHQRLELRLTYVEGFDDDITDRVTNLELRLANLENSHRFKRCEVEDRFRQLELRLANLETQRTPQDENDDPEWF